jgi:hypothetical protein
MHKLFRRNFAKYRIRDSGSKSAKVLNDYMARCHYHDGVCMHYDMGALDPLRKLSPEDTLATLLLGYEHFIWLLSLPWRVRGKFDDNMTYASGLDFAVQVLARNSKLAFSPQDLSRLCRAFLRWSRPTPCLPPRIIIGIIAKASGQLARSGALTPKSVALLHRVLTVLKRWSKEWDPIPPAHRRRIEKALKRQQAPIR